MNEVKVICPISHVFLAWGGSFVTNLRNENLCILVSLREKNFLPFIIKIITFPTSLH